MKAMIKETCNAAFILSPVIVLIALSALALRGNHRAETKTATDQQEGVNTVCRIVAPAGYTVFL